MSEKTLLDQWLAQEKPVLADGAMGTLLHAKGVSFDACFDELNLSEPDLVREIHLDYLSAGADLIETNTFGANRFKLAQHGLEDQVARINSEAVELARQAITQSAKDALVAGSVGPLGVRLAPFGRVQQEEAYEAYHGQIAALAEAGVDLLIIETQSDLHEVREALRAARAVTSIPVLAMMTFTRDDRTLLGDPPALVAERLAEYGADLIGANCSGGPAQLTRIAQQMQAVDSKRPLVVMPNAGWPGRVSGRIMYPADEEYFGEYAAALYQSGARIIGGCCGTTPAHTAAMRKALDNPSETNGSEVLEVRAIPRFESGDSPEEPTRFAQRLADKDFLIAVEVDPPRGFSTHKLLAGAHLLAEAGVDVINVADSPMARMRMSPWAVCQLIQRQMDIETVLHFPTRGRNLLRVQGDLLASHALGVRNVFVIMGDPTAVGDYPDAMDNYDLVPTGLIKLIKSGFNTGVDHSGTDIGGATSFFAGTALNLSAKNPEREAVLLKKKIEAGADFALTQPVYEIEPAVNFLELYRDRYGALDLPILVGVLPLYGPRHASFLHNELPGIEIPEHIRQRVASAGDPSPEEGVRIAIELVHEFQDLVQGVYIMPPFGRYNLAADIIDALREKTPLV